MTPILRAASAASITLVLCACGSEADIAGSSDPAALIGPTWRLVSLDGRPALPGSRVTASFTTDDRVSGSAGCNHYFGRATASAARLDVGLLGSTLMHCGADGVMEQERVYLAALEKAASYRLASGELRLGPGPDVVSLVFVAE